MHFMFNVECHLRPVVFIQQEEVGIAVDDPVVFLCMTALEKDFQTFDHTFSHRYVPTTAFSFCFLYMVGTVSISQELMIHTNTSFLKIQVIQRKTTELTDAHSGFQQYDKLIIILSIYRVKTDKVHPDCLLVGSECNTMLCVVPDHTGQDKIERVLHR